MADNEDKLVILQRKLTQKFLYQTDFDPCQSQQTIDWAHEALFFNMLIKRITDSSFDNSIIDENGKIWEVDNEFYSVNGLQLIHWLVNSSKYDNLIKYPISQSILDKIMAIKLNENPFVFGNKELLLQWLKNNVKELKDFLVGHKESITFKDILNFLEKY